jgi:hypothetical protein
MPSIPPHTSRLLRSATRTRQHHSRGRWRPTIEQLEERQLLSGATLPPGWSAVDVGNPGRAGSSSFDGTNWTVQGGGSDIWDTQDHFQYAYQSVPGDAAIIAHVTSVQNTNYWAKGGIMFRDGTDAGAPKILLAENPNGQMEFQWRDTAGGASDWTGSQFGPAGGAKWLKLVHTGNTFTALYATTSGTPSATDWVLVGSHNIAMSDITVGLAVCAVDDSALCTATFASVNVYGTPLSFDDYGFEMPVVGAGYQYNPSGSKWTFDGASGIAGNGSDLTKGNPDAPEGAQVAFLQGSGSSITRIGGAPGSTYILSFHAAQRASNSSPETIEVLIDGFEIGAFTPAGTDYATYSTNSLRVTAGPHTLQFVGIDLDGTDDMVFLDDIGIATAAPDLTVSITGAPLTAPVGTSVELSCTTGGGLPGAAGLTYAWTVTKNGTAVGSGSDSTFSFKPSDVGIYTVTVQVTDLDGNVGTDRKTIAVFNGDGSGSILLPAAVLADLSQKAAAGTPQWQAFKDNLDWGLNQILNEGDYQGSELEYIQDYALGYQVLKDTDPVTASKYADKAIALIKSGLNDFQKSGWEARQFLARGDGTTTTFTLPNADLIPSSFRVFVANVNTVGVTRSRTSSQDAVDYYQTFLKVSNTWDGPADYVQGVDWSHNGDLPNNLIDWSLPGNKPAPGATYYLTEASPSSASVVDSFAYTLNGSTLTFHTAPGANQAIYVEYVYGTHSADGSTLAYQQTSSGDGGFNSIMIDDSYPSRYLGKELAIGLDWLDGYVGFSPALRQQTIDMLVHWSDYVRDYGYDNDSPASNYGAGGYVSRVMTALALVNRSPEGPRLLSEVLAYRNTYLLPLLQDPTNSLYGGFWAEGWSYGQLATENILEAGLALEDSGQIDATPERQWASQVIVQLVSAQPAAGTVYDGGDWFAYPAPFPANDLFDVLGSVASDPTTQSYANYILQHHVAGNSSGAIDLLFRDPTAPAAYWSDLPLQYYASGTGLLTARSDWGNSPTWVSLFMGNPLWADHQSYTPGQLQIQRGADDLLVNASVVGNYQANAQKSRYGNTIIVNDGGAGYQVYPYSMGYWYGSPGVVVNAYEAGSDYTYLSGNYAAAYSPNTAPGSGGPVSELNREMVYLNQNYVVVYDRVTTLQASFTKQQQWNFLNNATVTVNGNSFTETLGSSKLFGQAFSTVPLTTTVGPVQVGNATVKELEIRNASPTASVRYVTAFQVGTSSTTAMDATEHVVSTDSRIEGSQIGNQLVLFGRNGTVDATTPVTYGLNGSAPVQNLLVDLQPGRTYQIQADGVVVATVTASSQGTVSFTTPAGAQTVQVSVAA